VLIFCVGAVTMQWSTVDVCGSAPERRLDFATCTLRLHQRSTVASANTTSVSQSQDTAAVCQTTPDECSGKTLLSHIHILFIRPVFQG